MKKILIIALASCSLFFMTECKKKKTETVTDPCANTVCLNGGTCVDGSCSCPTGYSGADCGTQRTPTKITITGIKITKFPALDGTNTWDPSILGSPAINPDIYVKVTQGGTLLITSSSINNVTTQSNVLPGIVPKDITDIVTQLNIELLDSDNPPVDADDTMGNINFSIYSNTNHFPTTLIVDNGVLTFEVTLSYTY